MQTVWFSPVDDPRSNYVFFSGEGVSYHAARVIADNLMNEDMVYTAWVEEDEE